MAAIGTIRNKFGWALIGLMILSLIAFILMGSETGSGGNRAQVSDDLALVDGNAISNSFFGDRLNTNINNYKQQVQRSTLSEEEMNSIRNSTYDQMITEEIYKKVYSKTGITVGEDEFRDMLSGTRVHQGIANSFKNPETGQFDEAAFNEFINTLDRENSPSDEPGTKRKAWRTFEEAIINERLTTKYNTLVDKSLTIPSVMAKDQYMNTKEQVSFDYVKIPYSSIVDSTLNLSDADLKSYMNNNSKKFEKDASVDLKFVSFPIVASLNDKLEAENWMKAKLNEWKTEKDDSLFVVLNSAQPFDGAYYGKNELVTANKDSIFDAELGSVFGYNKEGDSFVATKLLDRKMIPDSLKARHLLISLDDVKTQEEAIAKFNLFDSLYSLIDSAGYKLEDLTAQYSDDQANANLGGDLKTVKPGDMVKPFNDLIFFNMKQGEVKKVRTQYGLHIVEVYKARPTKLAVKVATLKKEILASKKTQEKAYASASTFYGKNNTMDKFLATEETMLINNAEVVTKDASTLPGINENARRIVQWAFKAENGEVSEPFSIGETYYVALLTNKNAKGVPNITNSNRLFVQTAAAKDKKATKIKASISGSDLNSIATANNTSIASAQNLTFSNVSIGNAQEPMVVGAALGMAEGEVSKPIAGEDGVYVISITSKVSAEDDPAAYASNKETLRNQLKGSVTSRLDEAVRKAANVVDNRLDFF